MHEGFRDSSKMLCGWRDGMKAKETMGDVLDKDFFCRVELVYICHLR